MDLVRPNRKRLLWAILLVASSWCAYASIPDYGELLERADAVRSVDPAEFRERLDELNARVAEADPRQLEHLQYLKAYDLAYAGRYDEAIAEAARLHDSATRDSLRFRAALLVANSYAATRDFAKGLAYLDKALALMDQVTSIQLRHDGMTVAAVLYNQVGQYALGQRFAEQILAGEPSERTRCFAGYLRLEAMRNQVATAIAPGEVESLVELCAEQHEALAANMARVQRSRMLAAAGDVGTAIVLLETHLAEIEATRYPRLISEAQSLLAEHRLAQGDLSAAESHARAAIEASQESAYSLPIVNAYRTLYEAALRRSDTAGALDHFRRFAEADKAYLDDVKARELAFQLVRHETQQKTQQIDLLNNQNRVLQLEHKVAAQSARNVQLVVLLLSVLLASIGYWAYKTKRTQVTFRKLAETDTLTGVSNRHHFSRRANEVLATCRRSGEEVALVMFDLDRFKATNDDYGHAVGDWVLERVAEACRATCRANDLFGRLGGEEFAFLLVGADLAAASERAQLCRARLRAIDTAPTGHDFSISASFGIATSASAGHDFHPLLARADEAMYRAKRAGRDRVAEHVSGG